MADLSCGLRATAGLWRGAIQDRAKGSNRGGRVDDMKKWPIIVAVVMLMSAWGSLQVLSHGEPVLAKKPFAEFPLTIAERWQGKEFGLEQNILDILKLSDYMMRVYVPVPRAQTM